jgi:hypothetical protein
MAPAPGPGQYTQQQQQQAWMAQQQQQQQPARSGWAGALPHAAAGAAASPFYELSGAAGVAQLHARLAAGAAAAAVAAGGIADDHDDLDLPTALPHDVASSHEDVAACRQHYVAGWAQGASAEAAAAAAAEAEAAQAAEADMFVGGSFAGSHASAAATSVSQSADDEMPHKQMGQQQQRPPQQQQQQLGAGLQRFGSREGVAPVAVTPAEAPVVVKGFVVQPRDGGAQPE